jgi:hypothetical protein
MSNQLLTVNSCAKGSLAKGEKEHVQSLIKCGIVEVLLTLINSNTDSQLVEICLCALKTIMLCSDSAPVDLLQSNVLVRLIGEHLRNVQICMV